MKIFMRTFLILLTILNAIVLLGQLWPEGAPTFAGTVNIVTLFLNLGLLIFLLTRRQQ